MCNRIVCTNRERFGGLFYRDSQTSRSISLNWDNGNIQLSILHFYKTICIVNYLTLILHTPANLGEQAKFCLT